MSIPSWARVGAKVVCIDASSYGEHAAKCALVKGAIYTIADVSGYLDCYGKVGVALIEAKPVLHPRYFALNRFRPLVSQQDDIAAHFQHHLKTDHRTTRKAGVDA